MVWNTTGLYFAPKFVSVFFEGLECCSRVILLHVISLYFCLSQCFLLKPLSIFDLFVDYIVMFISFSYNSPNMSLSFMATCGTLLATVAQICSTFSHLFSLTPSFHWLGTSYSPWSLFATPSTTWLCVYCRRGEVLLRASLLLIYNACLVDAQFILCFLLITKLGLL